LIVKINGFLELFPRANPLIGLPVSGFAAAQERMMKTGKLITNFVEIYDQGAYAVNRKTIMTWGYFMGSFKWISWDSINITSSLVVMQVLRD